MNMILDKKMQDEIVDNEKVAYTQAKEKYIEKELQRENKSDLILMIKSLQRQILKQETELNSFKSDKTKIDESLNSMSQRLDEFDEFRQSYHAPTSPEQEAQLSIAKREYNISDKDVYGFLALTESQKNHWMREKILLPFNRTIKSYVEEIIAFENSPRVQEIFKNIKERAEEILKSDDEFLITIGKDLQNAEDSFKSGIGNYSKTIEELIKPLVLLSDLGYKVNLTSLKKIRFSD